MKQYYKKVYMLLLDFLWRQKSTPFCTTYKCDKYVGLHAFSKNHHRQRIIGVNNTYYIISRQYIYDNCKRKQYHIKLQALANNKE